MSWLIGVLICIALGGIALNNSQFRSRDLFPRAAARGHPRQTRQSAWAAS